MSGVNKLGDISVNLLGVGAGQILMSINSEYGAFYSLASLQEQTVDLYGATTAVPAPAGVWLLMTGLAGLVTRRFVRR